MESFLSALRSGGADETCSDKEFLMLEQCQMAKGCRHPKEKVQLKQYCAQYQMTKFCVFPYKKWNSGLDNSVVKNALVSANAQSRPLPETILQTRTRALFPLPGESLY